MSSRVSQRTVYLVTAAIVASMIGGFALASLSTGGTNTSYQGSQTTTVSAVPGISYVSTQLIEVTSATGPFTTCTSVAPCSVTSAGAIDCAGGFVGSTTCAASDYAEQVNLTTDANTAFVGTVTLTVYVTGTPVGGALTTVAGIPFDYTQTSGTNSPTQISILFDVGTATSGPGTIQTVSVIATD
jgi:hypothetical protein